MSHKGAKGAPKGIGAHLERQGHTGKHRMQMGLLETMGYKEQHQAHWNTLGDTEAPRGALETQWHTRHMLGK